MIDRLREANEDYVQEALACSYVAELGEIEPAMLLEFFHCMLDQLAEPRGEAD